MEMPPFISIKVTAVRIKNLKKIWPLGGFYWGIDMLKAISSVLARFLNRANTFTKAQSTAPVVITSMSNHIATNATLSNIFTHILTENTTLDNPTNLVADTYYTWIVTQAASAKTLAYGNKFKWPGGIAMTVSTGAGAIDIITSLYDGTNLNTVFSQNFS